MKVRIFLDTVVAQAPLNASVYREGDLIVFEIKDGGTMNPWIYKAAALEAIKNALTVTHIPED